VAIADIFQRIRRKFERILRVYNDRRFLAQLYRLILEREPDWEGLENHLKMLANGLVTRPEIIKNFFYSDEYQNKLKTVGVKYDYNLLLSKFKTVCSSEPFKPFVQKPEASGPRLCGLADPRLWLDDEWSALLKTMRAVPHEIQLMSRKGFEWTHAVYGLKRLGFLNGRTRCLGVGAGHEALVYWLANNTGGVVATDLYEAESDWANKAGREGDPSILSDPKRYAPFPYKEDNLRFLRMDGRDLKFGDEEFDVIFSISSIEHFGGRAATAQSMREIGRVLKKGGCAVIVTELVLNGKPHPEFFTPEDLLEFVVKPSGLRLAQTPVFEMPAYAIENPMEMSTEASLAPQFVLNDRRVNDVMWTSVILFFSKEIPIGVK